MGKCVSVMQGAAFDLPQELGEALMAMSEELTKRKFTIDRPAALPMEDGGMRR